LDIKKYIKKNSIDLVLTSPPYCNLLNNTIKEFGGSDYSKNIYISSKRKIAKPYSNNSNDFGNLNWGKFSAEISKLMKILLEVVKEGSYNVWVIRDYRDMPEAIPYVNLHGKVIELATKIGWVLVDIVIWDQSDQRKLVKLGGQKCRRFYFNIGHTYIVIFRKNIKGERFGNSK
jgi:DNA modification methylase